MERKRFSSAFLQEELCRLGGDCIVSIYLYSASRSALHSEALFSCVLFAEVANREGELEEEVEKLKMLIHKQRDELRLTERELAQRNMDVDTVGVE